MSDIKKLSGSLLPSSTNTLVDARTRINSADYSSVAEAMAAISMPAVGLIICDEATGKFYTVNSLTDVKSGLTTKKLIGENDFSEFKSGADSEEIELMKTDISNLQSTYESLNDVKAAAVDGTITADSILGLANSITETKADADSTKTTVEEVKSICLNSIIGMSTTAYGNVTTPGTNTLYVLWEADEENDPGSTLDTFQLDFSSLG